MLESWTFMVYLDGTITWKVQYRWFPGDASIGLLRCEYSGAIDRIDGHDSSYGDWTGVKAFLYYQWNDTHSCKCLNGPGEVNMGNPATLANFVDWSKTNFPAQTMRSYCGTTAAGGAKSQKLNCGKKDWKVKKKRYFLRPYVGMKRWRDACIWTKFKGLKFQRRCRPDRLWCCWWYGGMAMNKKSWQVIVVPKRQNPRMLAVMIWSWVT